MKIGLLIDHRLLRRSPP